MKAIDTIKATTGLARDIVIVAATNVIDYVREHAPSSVRALAAQLSHNVPAVMLPGGSDIGLTTETVGQIFDAGIERITQEAALAAQRQPFATLGIPTYVQPRMPNQDPYKSNQ